MSFSHIASSLEDKKPESKDFIHLVFDIDETLTCRIKETNKSYLGWFKDRDLVIDDPKLGTYILHPGAVELLQYLFEMPNVHISFFSGAPEERNKLFVEKLLIRALGEDKYSKIRSEVAIFSHHHQKIHGSSTFKECFYSDYFDNSDNLIRELDPKVDLSYLYDNLFKDLNLVLKTGDRLESTLLIDDLSQNAAPKQRFNLLKIDSTTAEKLDIRREYPGYLESPNHLFYLTGMLKELFRKTQSGSDSLAENLFKLQFTKYNGSSIHSDPRLSEKSRREFVKKGGITYKNQYSELKADKSYYRLGLSELQKINPKLDFYHEQAPKYFNLPVTELKPTPEKVKPVSKKVNPSKQPAPEKVKPFFPPAPTPSSETPAKDPESPTEDNSTSCSIQ